jgi:hypothetical protein
VSHRAPLKRNQELCIEPAVVVAKMVMRDGRCIVTPESSREPSLVQRLTDISFKRSLQREREINVSCSQLEVRWLSGQWVEPMKPMRPAADDDKVAEPGADSFDQTSKGDGVLHVTTPC